ncbi:tryptophan--tRNA ligase [Nocardioides sp. Iso805N]|uniref:tryptophan--tRNA ligase n=1 Tax=Nocardioides sp. Iso805N TaxID=1283287 RepID=UPI00036A1A2F|nr:tryptophan--tRNA ligase [Nocardioides sp. Iso805N]
MNTLSLITPSGRLTLGNLLGALRPMAAAAGPSSYFGVADLHALTTPHSPALLRSRVAEMSTLLLACGLDAATLFVQSQVPSHRSLAYLLECVASTGELNRMIQFKEKGAVSSRASLYTYPALMAADILLYRTAEVPVGDDQRQHVELTRDLALRFNREYGEVFTVPRAVHPPRGARVMDLAAPERKMSKSAGDDHSGSIFLLDPPEVIRRKVMRAVTDSDVGASAVRSDRAQKPGVTNLLDILQACGGSAAGISTYGALKKAVADAVVAELEPLQKRYRELAADPAHVTAVYAAGAAVCREVTAPVLAAAEAAVGVG